MNTRRFDDFETGVEGYLDSPDALTETSTKLERRRLIEELSEKKRLLEELNEFDF